jgi:hypothetical protein
MRTIYLIGCSAKKCAFAQPAIDLYEGQLFLTQKEYVARVLGAKVLTDCFILSAKHGLVPSTKVIEPYEATNEGRFHRRVWNSVVAAQLIETFRDEPLQVYIFSGANYRGWMPSVLALRPEWQIHVPLLGLGIGEQKQRMKQMIDALPEHPDVSVDAWLRELKSEVTNG